MSRIDDIRGELLDWYREWNALDEGAQLLDEYEALIELRALENIMGIKVGPVE